MIRQELNPETCRLVTKHTKQPDGHFQRARHKNGSVFCFQWARHTNDPSSFWFQRARHKNGPGFILVPRGQTQEWLCFQWARHRNDPGSRWFQRARRRNGSRTYIYIYIVASKLRTPAPMDSKAGTFSVPDTRLFVGHSLVTGRVAPCLRIKFLKLG